jgi:hypothetical protein
MASEFLMYIVNKHRGLLAATFLEPDECGSNGSIVMIFIWPQTDITCNFSKPDTVTRYNMPSGLARMTSAEITTWIKEERIAFTIKSNDDKTVTIEYEDDRVISSGPFHLTPLELMNKAQTGLCDLAEFLRAH